MEHGHVFWQRAQCTQPLIGRKLADKGITQWADTARQVNVQELLYSARYRFETRPGRIIFLPRFSWFPQSLRVNIAVLAQSRPQPPPFTFYSNHCSSFDAAKSGVFFFCVVLRPDYGSRSPLRGLRDHTQWTHHNRQDSSGRVISRKR